MYRLTQRMKQRLRRDLDAYHRLFQGGRCSGWELEELFVNAIKSDTTAQHHVQWKEAGHDIDADILVRTNGTEYPVQIKSGQIKNVTQLGCQALVLSGYRLTRFQGNFQSMTNFLNNLPAQIIALPCRKTDEDDGRVYTYNLAYIEKSSLTGVSPSSWTEKGKRWMQITQNNVLLTLTENMSWQVWWSVPIERLELSDEFRIE